MGSIYGNTGNIDLPNYKNYPQTTWCFLHLRQNQGSAEKKKKVSAVSFSFILREEKIEFSIRSCVIWTQQFMMQQETGKNIFYSATLFTFYSSLVFFFSFHRAGIRTLQIFTILLCTHISVIITTSVMQLFCSNEISITYLIRVTQEELVTHKKCQVTFYYAKPLSNFTIIIINMENL